jgi:hypothetical protein
VNACNEKFRKFNTAIEGRKSNEDPSFPRHIWMTGMSLHHIWHFWFGDGLDPPVLTTSRVQRVFVMLRAVFALLLIGALS